MFDHAIAFAMPFFSRHCRFFFTAFAAAGFFSRLFSGFADCRHALSLADRYFGCHFFAFAAPMSRHFAYFFFRFISRFHSSRFARLIAAIFSPLPCLSPRHAAISSCRWRLSPPIFHYAVFTLFAAAFRYYLCRYCHCQPCRCYYMIFRLFRHCRHFRFFVTPIDGLFRRCRFSSRFRRR